MTPCMSGGGCPILTTTDWVEVGGCCVCWGITIGIVCGCVGWYGGCTTGVGWTIGAGWVIGGKLDGTAGGTWGWGCDIAGGTCSIQ